MIRTVVFMIIYEIRVYTRYFRVRFMIASKMFHERGAIFLPPTSSNCTLFVITLVTICFHCEVPTLFCTKTVNT